MQGFQKAARHLALLALLLRALVPAGWMPGGPAADTPFVICSVDGAQHQAPDGQKLPDDAAHHDACPFAAAPHLAKIPEAAPLATPSLRLQAASRTDLSQRFARLALYREQSPRAPPFSA